MKTIEERAKKYSSWRPIQEFYVDACYEQRNIDIEKATEALYTLMNDYGCDLGDIDQAKEIITNILMED